MMPLNLLLIQVFRSEEQGMIEKISRDLRFSHTFPNDRRRKLFGRDQHFHKNENLVRKAPPPKQLAVGGVAGWAAGYVTMKVDIANIDGWTILWLGKLKQSCKAFDKD